ncbi:unnamed protein product, partial [Symbiodinium sp. CCMP2592]
MVFSVVKELTQGATRKKTDGGTRHVMNQQEVEEWKEHFQAIQTGRGEVSENVWEDMESRDVCMELDDPPTQEEVRRAVNAMKRGKAGGEDSMVAEYLKLGGAEMQRVLYRVVKRCWEEATRAPDGKTEGLRVESEARPSTDVQWIGESKSVKHVGAMLSERAGHTAESERAARKCIQKIEEISSAWTKGKAAKRRKHDLKKSVRVKILKAKQRCPFKQAQWINSCLRVADISEMDWFRLAQDRGQDRGTQLPYPPVWYLYTDGSGGSGGSAAGPQMAGWGVVVYGVKDPSPDLPWLAALYGPVCTAEYDPVWMGARKGTNNTAELSAIGEACKRAMVLYDSEYAYGIATRSSSGIAIYPNINRTAGAKVDELVGTVEEHGQRLERCELRLEDIQSYRFLRVEHSTSLDKLWQDVESGEVLKPAIRGTAAQVLYKELCEVVGAMQDEDGLKAKAAELSGDKRPLPEAASRREAAEGCILENLVEWVSRDSKGVNNIRLLPGEPSRLVSERIKRTLNWALYVSAKMPNASSTLQIYMDR